MHQHVAAIATCRRAENGGKFKGSLASQIDILNKAAGGGLPDIDLELQSAVKCKPTRLQKMRTQRPGAFLS